MLALGTCAAYGGIPAMRNNPTGAMGLRDYLGADWTLARWASPIVNLPGCPVQPDNITETLLAPGRCSSRAWRRRSSSTTRAGRAGSSSRTVHETLRSRGVRRARRVRRSATATRRCLVKLGCSGPVVKCNVPARGWVNGVGGCPNVGGICIACTMPGFPDKFMPFVDPDRLGLRRARAARFTYGPVLRYFRDRRMRSDVRGRAGVAARRRRSCSTGHERRW